MKPLRGLALLIVLSAVPAAAIEFRSSLRSQTGYDSNVLSGRGDMVVEVTPRLVLADDDGRLTWETEYRPTYRYFVTENVDGGFSHIVNGRVAYQVTPRLRLELSDRFSRLKNVDLETSFGIDDPSIDLIDSEIDQRRTLSNRAALRMDWSITSRDVVSALVDHGLQQFDSEGRGDFQALQALARYRRTLTSEHVVGFDVSVRENTQETPGTGVERSTRFYSIQGAWVWEITPSWTFSARGGPAFVDAEELDRPDTFNVFRFATTGNQLLGVAGCGEASGLVVRSASCAPVERTPGNPLAFVPLNAQGVVVQQNAINNNLGPGLNQTEALTYAGDVITIGRNPLDEGPDDGISLTYFADVSLEKTWGEYVEWILSYRRSASTSASDFGSSTVADQVQSIVTWTPTQYTTFRLSAGWIRRQQERDLAFTSVAVRSVDLPGCFSPTVPAGFPACPATPFGASLLGTFDGVGEATSFLTQSVGLEDTQDQFILRLTGRYRVRDNVFLTGSGSYRYITRENTLADIDDEDRWRVLFGVEYRFDPITL
ncbi:MAG: hypothetical protein QNK05_07555 [Myxococcota bacterium]|nr:hypothetical protein [Myxococcota bacterium]